MIAQYTLTGQTETPIRFNRDSYLSVPRACGHVDRVYDAPGAYDHACRTDIECVTCDKMTRRAWLDYIGDRADTYAELEV